MTLSTPVANALAFRECAREMPNGDLLYHFVDETWPGARSASANAVELIVAADAIAGYVSLTRK